MLWLLKKLDNLEQRVLGNHEKSLVFQLVKLEKRVKELEKQMSPKRYQQ